MTTQLIAASDAQPYADGTKLVIGTLDDTLLQPVQDMVIQAINGAVDCSGFVSPATTPQTVRTIIGMFYVCWLYRRIYSEDTAVQNTFADELEAAANLLIAGINDGSINLPTSLIDSGTPLFYPTDASTAACPTSMDTSVGPAAFSMGMIF